MKTTEFQSPQWGSNSKNGGYAAQPAAQEFQSPQWGSNSKKKLRLEFDSIDVSVPAMGK